MLEQNRALVLRWFEEIWNNGNESAIDELWWPHGTCYGFPDPDASITREEFKAAFRAFRSTFSGIHVTVEDTICEGEKVAARWSATMVHSGPGLGFAPTGEKVSLNGMCVMLGQEGRMLHGWNALDMTQVVANLSRIAAQQALET